MKFYQSAFHLLSVIFFSLFTPGGAGGGEFFTLHKCNIFHEHFFLSRCFSFCAVLDIMETQLVVAAAGLSNPQPAANFTGIFTSSQTCIVEKNKRKSSEQQKSCRGKMSGVRGQAELGDSR